MRAGEVVFCDHCSKEISKSAYYRHKRYEYDQDVIESDDELDLTSISDCRSTDGNELEEEGEFEGINDEQPIHLREFEQVVGIYFLGARSVLIYLFICFTSWALEGVHKRPVQVITSSHVETCGWKGVPLGPDKNVAIYIATAAVKKTNMAGQ